jgi:hypothetical protein
MDFEAANVVLARVKYKDGFRVQLFPSQFDGEAILKLSHALTVDPADEQIDNRPQKAIQVGIGKMTDSDLVHRVFAEILSWEQHEACEYFRFDGVQIFSPHANVHVLREALAQ